MAKDNDNDQEQEGEENEPKPGKSPNPRPHDVVNRDYERRLKKAEARQQQSDETIAELLEKLELQESAMKKLNETKPGKPTESAPKGFLAEIVDDFKKLLS